MNRLSLDELMLRADALIEAMPYISKFRGSRVVIKYGGAALVDADLKAAVIEDLHLMQTVGILPIIVHGGGKEITQLLQQLGAETTFIDGQRVTNQAALDVAEMVLAGRINGEITAALNTRGARAVGISGKGGALLRARKLASASGGDLGYVGEIAEVRPRVIEVLTDGGFIPVVAPLGLGEDGQSYNINADVAAEAIAVALRADKLIFLSDIPGLMRDPRDPDSVIGTVHRTEVEELIASGVASGGMIPKLRSAAKALDACGKVHILDGRRRHSLLLELFTEKGIGTQIVP
jgi:acetylglutamate kinase